MGICRPAGPSCGPGGPAGESESEPDSSADEEAGPETGVLQLFGGSCAVRVPGGGRENDGIGGGGSRAWEEAGQNGSGPARDGPVSGPDLRSRHQGAERVSSEAQGVPCLRECQHCHSRRRDQALLSAVWQVSLFSSFSISVCTCLFQL